jgi:hypothetical protein
MVAKKNAKSVIPNSNTKGTEKLKWETAKELGLDDDLAAGGNELTVREAGKIGGNMTKKLVEKGETQLEKEDSE